MTDELSASLFSVDCADAILKRHFRNHLEVTRKSDNTFVTQADLDANTSIISNLSNAFSDIGFLSEETGQSGNQKTRWILDPLDGTHGFIAGKPYAGTLLALEKNGELVLGVVSLPMLGERIWAEKGKGCFWNGKPCRVSNVDSLNKSSIVLEKKRSTAEGYALSLDSLSNTVRQTCEYSDAYSYFLVATGQVDGLVEGYPHYWDVAGPSVCVREAAGKISQMKGKIKGLSVASNALLHESLCMQLCNGRI